MFAYRLFKHRFCYLPVMQFTTSYISVIALLTFAHSACLGQQDITSVIDTNLTIVRDVRLDSLVMRHIRVNEAKGEFAGYRLQLFSGSGTTARQEANSLRANFMAKNPETPAYIVYEAPNFKVRIGDFRTELEAIKLQRDLEYQFPGAFVVKDNIKFPQLEIEKEKDLEEEESELEIELEDSENQKSSNGLLKSEEMPKKK